MVQLLQRERAVPYMVPSVFSMQASCLASGPVCIVVSVYLCLLFLLLVPQPLYPTHMLCLQVWLWSLAVLYWGEFIDGQSY